jgi:hypothetical protein
MAFTESGISSIDIERRKIDCLSFVMCPLPAQLIIGFFSAPAVNGTNEETRQAVRAVKQSIFLDVYDFFT